MTLNTRNNNRISGIFSLVVDRLRTIIVGRDDQLIAVMVEKSQLMDGDADDLTGKHFVVDCDLQLWRDRQRVGLVGLLIEKCKIPRKILRQCQCRIGCLGLRLLMMTRCASACFSPRKKLAMLFDLPFFHYIKSTMTFSFSGYSDAVFLLLGCYNNGKRFRDLSKILCF